MSFSLERPLVELWLLGSFLREPPEHPQERAGLLRARTELLEDVQPEIFREPLLRSAWFAVIAEIAEFGRATPEGVCGRLAGRVREDEIPWLLGLLRLAKNQAEFAPFDGRWHANDLTHT